MFNASLKQLSDQLAEKKISSTELTTEFLKRIKQLNSEYNAFITVNEEMSLDQACLLYTSPSPRDRTRSRMPSSA